MKTGVKGKKYLLIPARVLAFVVLVFLLSGFFSIFVVNAESIRRDPSAVNLFDIVTPQENCFINGGYSSFSKISGLGGAFVDSLGRVFSGATEEQIYDSQLYPCQGVERDVNSIFLNILTPKDRGLNGILQSTTATILEQRPASGTWFLEQKVYALTNPGKVYAQTSDINVNSYYPGTGFDLLKPIYSFWGWSVNVVYGFLILLIIVIAFAIMFQQRLGSKTAITLQTAIPSIALAMILVPFSYAISGAFIDLITLGTNVVHGFLIGPGSPGRPVYEEAIKEDLDCQNLATGDCNRGYYADDWRVSILRFRDKIDLRPVFSEVGEGLQLSVFNPIVPILNILDEQAITGQAEPGASAWFGAIVNVILSLMMIWFGIKTALRLLGKYVQMITMPIISPFIFASAAIPGTGTKNVVNYAKNLAACSFNFIVAYIVILLVLIFTSEAFLSTIPELRSAAFVPPVLGITASLGGGSTTLSKLLFTVIGLGLYFSMPSMLAGVDKSFGVSNKLIPDFLKPALDGFKESWNVTTKGAPAAIAKATTMTAGGVDRVAKGTFNTRYNIRHALDKARGIADDDPNSAAFKRKEWFKSRRQELLTKLDSSSSIPQRMALQAQLADLDVMERMAGKEFSTKAEEGKKRGIKVNIQYLNPNDGSTLRYNFTQQDLVRIKPQLDPAATSSGAVKYEVIGSAKYWTLTIAKMVIEPENVQFPVDGNKVSFSKVDPNAAGEEGFSTTEAESKAGGTRYVTWKGGVGGDDIFDSKGFEFTNSTKVGSSDIMLRTAKSSDSDTMSSIGGKKIEFLVNLCVNVNTKNIYDVLFDSKTGILVQGIQTPKRAVAVGPFSSGPFRISIGVNTR